jgi:2-polyprenyl-3-methyl-5-hydroxy-6-metoxy-1,4-benzoquinol methylase
MGEIDATVQTETVADALPNSSGIRRKQRPAFHWSDIWRAPLHDLPMRDEIIFQYLPLASDMSVLEVGPGVGFTAFRLARGVRHITLLDIASESILQLRKNLVSVPNLSAVCADACATDLAATVGGPFDVVLSLDMFQFVGNPQACLKNFASVLPPGGRLLLQWPNYPLHRTKAATYVRSRRELDEMVRRAGFKEWTVHALRLRPFASVLYREFHERPLALYRRLRSHNGVDAPQNFDQTWTFQRGQKLERCKGLLHLAWAGLVSAMRLGGDCFQCHPLGEKLDGNLLLLAQR